MAGYSSTASSLSTLADSEFSDLSRNSSSQEVDEMAMQPPTFKRPTFKRSMKLESVDDDSCAIDDESEDEEEGQSSFFDFPKRQVVPFHQQHQVPGALKLAHLKKSCTVLVQKVQVDKDEKSKQSQTNQAPVVKESKKVTWGESKDASQQIYKADDVMMNFLMAHAVRAGTDHVKATWKRNSTSGATNSWDFPKADYLKTSSRECGGLLWSVCLRC
ncbi:hypothetical protein ACMFMG_009144 [Clarireedia jacksonii]